VKVLVDTPVWSLALRRKNPDLNSNAKSELAALVEEARAVMIGPIRQEILSGVKERGQFERLRDYLRAFVDVEMTPDDYEQAAAFFNQCRAKGIQGSNTDFLICAVASRRELAIFTTDRDFAHYAKMLPIALHEVR